MTESFLKNVSELIDPRIKEVLELSVDPKRKELIGYQMGTGGKRLRPALAIASCLACRGKIKDVLYAAAGLEILHNCTLIYDDMIDNSVIRRGRSTLWAKHGKSMAECIGLSYSASIFQAANRSPYSQEIGELFAKTMKVILEGEILDILFEQSGRQNESYVLRHRYKKIGKGDYLRMITQKTASLIEACCEAGAVCAGASKKELQALKKYGFNLGTAFQIRDDILDIFGKERSFGKKIGKDIEERKLGNIVILYALQELALTKEDRKLSAILNKNKVGRKDIKRALNLINKTRAREKSLLLEKRYIGKAKEGLQELAPGKWNNLLLRVADFIIERNK